MLANFLFPSLPHHVYLCTELPEPYYVHYCLVCRHLLSPVFIIIIFSGFIYITLICISRWNISTNFFMFFHNLFQFIYLFIHYFFVSFFSSAAVFLLPLINCISCRSSIFLLSLKISANAVSDLMIIKYGLQFCCIN